MINGDKGKRRGFNIIIFFFVPVQYNKIKRCLATIYNRKKLAFLKAIKLYSRLTSH